ncbi:hypothetical protein C1645_842541 [Glomus cerebriforme]|uniref:Uncharacterized protein n=1 Tax=Glomus cerebriforme TaxID=658196 RepID=A0A397RZJ3_9GLOM|nr:hypothetical protein C1645_842541 [Glomus cerebriforme]
MNDINDIKYKFAINLLKPVFEREEKIIFEGNGDKDDRILDVERINQFGIWKNNVSLNQKLNIYLNKIQDYAFVNYIFNSIGTYNLKDKVMEYQHILNLYNEFTIHLNYELPKLFLFELLLDLFDNYNSEIFEDNKDFYHHERS